MALKRTAKKAEKKAAKLAEKKGSQVAAAAESAGGRAEKAVEELQKVASQVGPVVSEGAREARSRANDLAGQYGPVVEERLREQAEKISANLGPRAEKISHDVQEDYLPRARKTAETTGTVLKAAVGAARKELDKGQGEIKSAVLAPTPAPKKNRAGKVLLVLGLAAAGAAAGYVVWKKTRPVEDPWAPPADFARAHYPASAGDESASSEVSDTVGSAEAGDVASSLKAGEPAEAAESAENAAEDGEKRGTHRGES